MRVSLLIMLGAAVSCRVTSRVGEDVAPTAREATSPSPQPSANDAVAQRALALEVAQSRIASSFLSTCAMRSDGRLFCWGENSQGELGQAQDKDYNCGPSFAELPMAVNTGAQPGRSLRGGMGAYCTFGSGVFPACWGNAFFATTVVEHRSFFSVVRACSPLQLEGVSADLADIAMGFQFTCMLHTDGRVRCMGYNSAGQLGAPELPDTAVPIEVTGLEERVVSLSASRSTLAACAVLEGGGVRCWGESRGGLLGQEAAPKANPPVAIGGVTDAIEVKLGNTLGCVRLRSGGVSCWGSYQDGETGEPGPVVTTPESVAGVADAVSLSVSHDHACALLSDARIVCWGGRQVRGPWLAVESTFGARWLASQAFRTCAQNEADEVLCWSASGERRAFRLGEL